MSLFSECASNNIASIAFPPLAFNPLTWNAHSFATLHAAGDICVRSKKTAPPGVVIIWSILLGAVLPAIDQEEDKNADSAIAKKNIFFIYDVN